MMKRVYFFLIVYYFLFHVWRRSIKLKNEMKEMRQKSEIRGFVDMSGWFSSLVMQF